MTEPIQQIAAASLAPGASALALAAGAAPLVELPPEAENRLQAQADSYAAKLLASEFGSDAFRAQLDQANSIGRSSIAKASALTGELMTRSFSSISGDASFRSLQELRSTFAELNPGNQNLLSAHKILGFIPYGTKLQAYLRKYSSASNEIARLIKDIQGSKDMVNRDIAALDDLQSQMWSSATLLKEAAFFAERLDERLTREVETLRPTHPLKAEALEQEVLFYARQAHSDILAQLTVTLNAYRQAGMLKKTGRELANGCDRMATTGMSAMALAQAIARVMGTQIKVNDALRGSSEAIGDLIVGSSEQLGDHIEAVKQMASNPVIAAEKLKLSFDNTTKALESLDKSRSEALETMAKTNASLKALVAEADREIQERRGAASRPASPPSLDIPA